MKKFLMGLLMCVMVLGSVMTVSAAPQSFDGVMFDPEYYAANNQDVVAAVGNNTDLLFAHYVNFGAAEGRAAFDPATLCDETDMVGAIPVNKPAPVVPGVTPWLPLYTNTTPENLDQAYIDDLFAWDACGYVEPIIIETKTGKDVYAMTDEGALQLGNLLRYASGAVAGFPNGSMNYSASIDKVEKNSPRQYTFYITIGLNDKESSSVITVDFDKYMIVEKVWILQRSEWTAVK